MRLEATNLQDHYKFWMVDELGELQRATLSHRNDLLIQFGGYVGLRAFEVPQVTSDDTKWTNDGEHYRIRAANGKNTTGTGGSLMPLTSWLTSKARFTGFRVPKGSAPTRR